MMVALYVNGNRVGTLEENPDVLRRLVEAGETVEFRTEGGKELGTFHPSREPLVPWDPTITKEELDRRAADPGGMTLAEFWKQMGVR